MDERGDLDVSVPVDEGRFDSEFDLWPAMCVESISEQSLSDTPPLRGTPETPDTSSEYWMDYNEMPCDPSLVEAMEHNTDMFSSDDFSITGPSLVEAMAHNTDMFSSDDFSVTGSGNCSDESLSGNESHCTDDSFLGGEPPLQWWAPDAAAVAAPAPEETSAPDDTSAHLAAQKARYPAQSLSVRELLALMRVDGAAAPSTRPLRLPEQQEPMPQAAFREPRDLQRRQKLSVGKVDRWKNSGGKSAKLTLDIPKDLQRGESNVLVVRHGRILRVDGTEMRYRQWSYGVKLPDGTLREENLEMKCNDVILYQAFTEAAVKAGRVAPLVRRKPTAENKKRKLKDSIIKAKKTDGKTDMDLRLLAGSTGHETSGTANEVPNVPAMPSVPAVPSVSPVPSVPATVDWGLLSGDATRQELQIVQADLPSKRRRRRASTISMLMAAAVLGLLAYHRRDGSHKMPQDNDTTRHYNVDNQTGYVDNT